MHESDNGIIEGFAVLAMFFFFPLHVEITFHSGRGRAFTYDVRCFGGIFDLPTYPNQILYYISLYSKMA